MLFYRICTRSAFHNEVSRFDMAEGDREFGLVAPLVAQKAGSGKKRIVDIREVLNAIFYRTRTGCQWRMLPSDKGLVSRLVLLPNLAR